MGISIRGRTPTRLDVEAVALRGGAVPLAAAFTFLGRAWPLTAVALVAAAVAFGRRGDARPIAILGASQVLSQAAVAACKRIFRRERPDGWLLYAERDLSYPSGHAVTAIVFYGGLLTLALRDFALPPAVVIVSAALCGICIAGLPWSRLALGAHYATDVLGGILFGVAWFCATAALLVAIGVA